MARSQLKQLLVSLESEETPNEDAVIEGGVDSMERTAIEIAEAYEELDELEEDIEELEEIEEGLESIATSLEAALEQGGIDAIAAQFVHHAVGAYTERLGLESSDLLPGLESFGGDSGRAAATTVSLESVGETLKRIWNAIKAAVEKAIKAVTDFFAKVFGGIDKVITRIEALEKEVGEIKSEGKKTDGKATVNVGSPNSLMLGGKVDGASLVKGAGNLNSTFAKVKSDLSKVTDVYKKASDEVTKLKDKNEEGDAEKANAAIMDVKKKLIDSISKQQGTILPGDKTLVTTTTSDSGEKAATVALATAKNAKAFSGKSEIDALSIAEMEKILSESKKIAKEIKDSKSEIDKVKTAREEALKAVKTVVDASDRGRVGKVWTKSKAQLVLRSVQKDELRPFTQLVSHSFGVLRSVLAVVESSTKQYKEEKKDAA